MHAACSEVESFPYAKFRLQGGGSLEVKVYQISTTWAESQAVGLELPDPTVEILFLARGTSMASNNRENSFFLRSHKLRREASKLVDEGMN